MAYFYLETDIKKISDIWAGIQKASKSGFSPIRSEEDYDKKVSLLNAVLASEETILPSLFDELVEFLSIQIERYDEQHYKIEQSDPVDVLSFLMESNNLKQVDLSNVIKQSNLSGILNRKRNISVENAFKLADYFNVNPLLFLKKEAHCYKNS